ncbi:Peptidyl-prolyl cis-trans isomerase surA [Delftia tsuruhatensis]|uniref:peptidylprolyl isomerase n=1 Tax=Delftia tsuruhatensis TaxID=180282 RepID=UPI001E6CC25F|nr:peptidylprolyl isomerase [Delftia tsuruhatensis]CAB5706069.1 Peptidyl-prolyl cis-trans isomerase surA [Delftia tsuruhatensis]CAC9693862.1 Peptidyl-prolyl cis-trans isomerase surA [Delftia tsuruhatensis]
MRFLSQTHCSAAVAVALALLASTAQAQGLRVPGQTRATAPQAGDAAVTRALDATNLPSARERGGNAGVRSADYIVAVVNSEPVTNNEVRARMVRVAQNIAEQGGQMPPEALLAREVLERLIVEKAQLQEAKDTGLRVDDYAVDQALGNVARQNGMDKAGLLARLRADGVDEKQFREELRRQITLQRLRERDVDGRVRVTEADIDRYLAEQRRGGGEQAPAAVNLGHILIAVKEDAGPAEVAEREARARQAAEAARTQPDFKAVVKEFSDVPDGQGGGAMGMRPLDRYPELFAKAVGQAPLGGIVGPFRSGAGFHVLKVLEKSQAGMPAVVTQNHARHILLRIGDQMTEAEAARRLADYKRRVDSGQASFESLAREFSQDGSARNGGDLGWSSPGQFVPEFEQVLDQLQPGQVSDPLVSRFGVHLIQLIERRQAALTPREQRDMVRNVVRERKLETDYQTWLQELRGRAYVEYREPPQ